MGLCGKRDLQNPRNIRGFREQVRRHNALRQTLIVTPKRKAPGSNPGGNATINAESLSVFVDKAVNQIITAAESAMGEKPSCKATD